MRSPLRYPGGKQKAIAKILAHFPAEFKEYREPFLGGGCILLQILEKYPGVRTWANDLNPELYVFWQQVKEDISPLVDKVATIRKGTKNGKNLFTDLASADITKLSQLERAVRFFVLNRISFSGLVEASGYSEAAFQGRFTDSSIERLNALQSVLANTKITDFDYSELLSSRGEDVFLYLDPPYLANSESRLYGRDGTLHQNFNHELFAKNMEKCPHEWLITYDDCQQVRDNFAFANIFEWELQYGMNNFRQATSKKGKELFIKNY